MKKYIRSSYYSNPKTENQLNQIIKMIKCNKSELIRFLIEDFYMNHMENKLKVILKEIELLEIDMKQNKEVNNGK